MKLKDKFQVFCKQTLNFRRYLEGVGLEKLAGARARMQRQHRGMKKKKSPLHDLKFFFFKNGSSADYQIPPCLSSAGIDPRTLGVGIQSWNF